MNGMKIDSTRPWHARWGVRLGALMTLSLGIGLAVGACSSDSSTDVTTDAGADGSTTADGSGGSGGPQAPVALSQKLTTVRNLALSIGLQATDNDSTGLTYAIVQGPTHGALTPVDPKTGLVTYTPESGYVGQDAFTFKANDGALDSNVATIDIEIVASPRPIAQAQAVTTDEDVPKTITLDAPGGGATTFAIVTQPMHGSLSTVNGADVTYTPAKDYNGNDSFTFSATDDGATFTQANIAITVNPVNDAPVATGQSGGTGFAGVPINFTLNATDAETAANMLTYAAGNAVNGTLGSVVGNTVQFTPTAAGPASFTFTANDGALTSAPATVSLTVNDIAGDCMELYRAGIRASGVYTVDPDGAAATYSPIQVYCDMASDGGGWMRVLNHDVSAGYFASLAEAASKNEGDPTNDIYSILTHLEGFRRNGGFAFRIDWPAQTTKKNIWEQTSNPTVAGPVTGYRGIRVELNSNFWGGLEQSTTTTYTLLDGSVNHANWWYAIGQIQFWSGNGIPASQEIAGDGTATRVELWVRPPAKCGNGVKEPGETCDDNNTDDGDGCSSTCAVERPQYKTCLQALAGGGSVGDGAYVLDPDGAAAGDAGATPPVTVYCDMQTNGGGWMLIGKAGAGNFTGLSDTDYINLIANPTNHVNPEALSDPNLPAYSSMAFLNRAATNALFHAGTKVVRVMMANNLQATAANGTYFQKKESPAADWDFWHAMRNARLWNSDGTESGGNVNHFGTDFKLTNQGANFLPGTNTVLHSGDGTFGWWSAANLTLIDASSLAVSRHGGLLCDGHNSGWQWLLTTDPADPSGRWKNDSHAAKSLVWIR